MKIGDKVKLKSSNAKWYLDNPDIYESASGTDEEYEPETLIHLMCCLGEPVYGTVIDKNTGYYAIEFKIAGLSMWHWYERHAVTRVK